MNELANLLPVAWYAFLARFQAPTEIQQQACKPILQGGSALLASATASGKTEAYMAPLCERWLRDLRSAVLRIVVVSPTRALTNDLCRRLTVPLKQCGIGFVIRTGDHPNALRNCQAGVLFTTPESLDSLLCRCPDELTTIRSVVMDELHVLEGTARGDQASFLLERLEQIVWNSGKVPLQRIVATATSGCSQVLVDKYLSPSRVVEKPGIPVVVDTEKARAIKAKICKYEDISQVREIIGSVCERWKAHKVLVFVTSRAAAEELGESFSGKAPFWSAVFVHHGSLACQERERVEHQFLRASTGICVATSTLELGIDIGDVDLIALLGPSADVASFVQRIGRGNRRGGCCQVLGLADSPAQEARFAHLLQCARAGILLPTNTPFRSSVVAQQALSLAFQNKHKCLTAQALANRCPGYLSERFTTNDCQRLLLQMAKMGLFKVGERSRFLPSATAYEMFERGHIHHNIDSGATGSDTVDVYDEYGSRVIGQVERSALDGGKSLVKLGGNTRVVLADDGGRVRTRRVSDPNALAKFRSKGRAECSFEYAQDFARYLQIGEDLVPYCEVGHLLVLGHFLGSRLGFLLPLVLRQELGITAKANEYVCWVEGEPLSSCWPRQPLSQTVIRQILAKHMTILKARLSVGVWHKYVPEAWLQEDLASLAQPVRLWEFFKRTQPRRASLALETVLRSLLPQFLPV